jgi:H/ACA ribonucleoprotein complex non-core subunit NAF1
MSQFPFQPPYQQSLPQFPAGVHINPAFFAAVQQAQQQQQQPQAPQQYPQQPYQSTPFQQQQQQQYQPHISQETFDQVKAQLDFLRQLNGGNAPAGGQSQ